jgi:hypothetical protein
MMGNRQLRLDARQRGHHHGWRIREHGYPQPTSEPSMCHEKLADSARILLMCILALLLPSCQYRDDTSQPLKISGKRAHRLEVAAGSVFREPPSDALTHSLRFVGAADPPLRPMDALGATLGVSAEVANQISRGLIKTFTIGRREIVFAQNRMEGFHLLSDGDGRPAAIFLYSDDLRGNRAFNNTRLVDSVTTIIDCQDGSLWFSGMINLNPVGILHDRFVIDESFDDQVGYALGSSGKESEVVKVTHLTRKRDNWRPLGICSGFILECDGQDVRAIDPDRFLIVARARATDYLREHGRLAEGESITVRNIYSHSDYAASSFSVGKSIHFLVNNGRDLKWRYESVAIEIVEKGPMPAAR